MARFDSLYLNEVVTTQSRLFDLIAVRYPQSDTEDFIVSYLKSRTRAFIDAGQAYVMTLNEDELWEYFRKTDGYSLKPGPALAGFMPWWVGEFYAYYGWHYDLASSLVIDLIPLDFLKKAYWGLHDLELDLAAEKVGRLPEIKALRSKGTWPRRRLKAGRSADARGP